MFTGREIIQKIRELNFPIGKYIVLGGSSLAVRNIRDTKDLDILLLPELFNKLSREGWDFDVEYERKWNKKRLKKEDIELYPYLYLERQERFLDVQELINSADMIDGIPFQPLKNLIMCKLESRREKDLNDVKLIEEYLGGR